MNEKLFAQTERQELLGPRCAFRIDSFALTAENVTDKVPARNVITHIHLYSTTFFVKRAPDLML